MEHKKIYTSLKYNAIMSKRRPYIITIKCIAFYPFGNDERYMGKYLLDNTQNAKNWIVGKPIKIE